MSKGCFLVLFDEVIKLFKVRVVVNLNDNVISNCNEFFLIVKCIV